MMRDSAVDDYRAIREAMKKLHPDHEDTNASSDDDVDFLIMPNQRVYAWKAISDRAKQWMQNNYSRGKEWHLLFAQQKTPKELAAAIATQKEIINWTYRAPKPEEM